MPSKNILIFRRRLGRIEADYVLLASGVIVAACICVHGEDLISFVLMTLQKTTGIPIDSIRNFYIGIYQTVSFFDFFNFYFFNFSDTKP